MFNMQVSKFQHASSASIDRVPNGAWLSLDFFFWSTSFLSSMRFEGANWNSATKWAVCKSMGVGMHIKAYDIAEFGTRSVIKSS
jgi:hypothetical protein